MLETRNKTETTMATQVAALKAATGDPKQKRVTNTGNGDPVLQVPPSTLCPGLANKTRVGETCAVCVEGGHLVLVVDALNCTLTLRSKS